MLRTYNGAVSVVTGAASGIGRCLAEGLAKRGSEVVLADLQIELAETIASSIRAKGHQAQAFKIDVADASAVDTLIRNTVERTGRLDYLFNNAGIGIGGPFAKHTLDDWDRLINVNMRGAIHGVHSAYPIMQRQGFGHIINTASAAGLFPSTGTTPYAATKYALVGFSTSLRLEAAAEGIRVSVLCPGIVRTPILEGGGKYGTFYRSETPVEQKRKMLQQIKPMPPEQFAHQALNAIAKNQAIIVIPSWWKLFWWLNRVSPDLLMLVMRKKKRPQG